MKLSPRRDIDLDAPSTYHKSNFVGFIENTLQKLSPRCDVDLGAPSTYLKSNSVGLMKQALEKSPPSHDVDLVHQVPILSRISSDFFRTTKGRLLCIKIFLK